MFVFVDDWLNGCAGIVIVDVQYGGKAEKRQVGVCVCVLCNALALGVDWGGLGWAFFCRPADARGCWLLVTRRAMGLG